MIHGLISISLIIFIFILYVEIKKCLINRKLRNFESPHQIPVLGIAYRFLGKSNSQIINIVFDFFDEVKTTPIRMWFGPILTFGIADPNDIRIIMTNEHCLSKPYFYDHLHCKSSIIVTDREIWRPNRRAMNTAFNIHSLHRYLPLINEKSIVLLKQMETHLEEPGDIYRTIFIGMFDMVTRTTMGCDMQLQSERGSNLYVIVKQIMNNIQYRMARIWLRWDFVYHSLSKVGRDERRPLKDGNNFIGEMYDKRVNQLNVLKSQGIDYLQEANERNTMNILEKCLMLEQKGVFSRTNVLDQMRVIILAGIDTSSITLFGTLLMLAINQRHQELVVDELRSVFESADCDVTQEHLAGLKYMERAIKESMRLLPPVPFIARKTSADIELPKGTIPKGSIVGINIMHMHRNPNIWGENVLEFDPDRFLPENIAKRPPFSYIPFSAGPRNCIGMKYAMISAKITLSHLLRRYKFTSDLCFSEIRLNTHLVTEVINEKPLRMERRNF